MTTTRILLFTLLLCVGGFAVGWLILPPPDSPSQTEDEPPAPRDSQASQVEAAHRFSLTPEDRKIDREKPALAVDAKGRVLLAWVSQTNADACTLFLSRSGDGGVTFTEPVAFRKVPIYRWQATIQGRPITFSTNVMPRLSARAEKFTLGWTESLEGGPRVVYHLARSHDGGQHFSAPVVVHGNEAVRPGFTGLAVGDDGVTACVWLDGRKGAQQVFGSLVKAGEDTSPLDHLVYAGPDGKGICPCCDTEVLRLPDGRTLVAFRNADSGNRDIYVTGAEKDSTTFSPPVAVSPQRWQFAGCPHDGPALAQGHGRLYLAWMDAHTGRQRVSLASSPLDRFHFTPATVSPQSPGEQGHPHLAATETGEVHLVWSENPSPPSATKPAAHGHHHVPPAGSSRFIFYMVSNDEGATFTLPLALSRTEGAFQTRPVIAVGPKGPLVAWMETTDREKRVVCVKLKPQTNAVTAKRDREVQDGIIRR